MFLKKINNIYHFRKATPLLIKKLVAKSELSRSFKTDNHELAKKLADRLNKIVIAIETNYRFRIITDDEVQQKLLEIGVLCDSTDNKPLVEDKFDLGLLFDKFSKQQLELGKWSLKTRMEYNTSFKLFQKYCDEKGQPEINHRFLFEYRDLLMKLPPNLNKFKHLKNKKLVEIAQMEHEARLSDRQINKYLVFLTNFFKWLTTHEYIEKNPAHSLLLAKSTQVDEERNAYTVEEIKRIISSLQLARDEFVDRPERIWVPLIALYSGLRLGEVCQLHRSDIAEAGGILYFDINQGGVRRLKSSASQRKVPIHPNLLNLGLMDYVQSLNASKCKLLFPSLVSHSVNGFGNLLGKWFTIFNRKHITQDPKKTFHSIRHSVANELKQLQIPGEVISELLGHKVESITMNRYGKRYRPEVLLEAIKQLPW